MPELSQHIDLDALQPPVIECFLGLGVLAVGALVAWTQPATQLNFQTTLLLVGLGWILIGHGYWRNKRDA